MIKPIKHNLRKADLLTNKYLFKPFNESKEEPFIPEHLNPFLYYKAGTFKSVIIGDPHRPVVFDNEINQIHTNFFDAQNNKSCFQLNCGDLTPEPEENYFLNFENSDHDATIQINNINVPESLKNMFDANNPFSTPRGILFNYSNDNFNAEFLENSFSFFFCLRNYENMLMQSPIDLIYLSDDKKFLSLYLLDSENFLGVGGEYYNIEEFLFIEAYIEEETTLINNEFVNPCITYNDNTKTLTIYYKGFKASVINENFIIPDFSSTKNLQFLGSYFEKTYLDASLLELLIFDYALSDSQYNQLVSYEAELFNYSPNLIT